MTPLKNKILKSQVGVVSHRHNPHRASVTDLLSGHHSNTNDIMSNAGSQAVSPNVKDIFAKTFNV